METEYSRVYWKIFDAIEQKHPRVISNCGGTRSTKTYSILQFLNDLIPKADKTGDITSVVSETLPHLKKGAIRDFEKIRGTMLKLDPRWNASDLVYTYPNGAKLEFFSVDNPQKVQGPSRKRLFVNEANHIQYESYRQLAIRTTGTIFIDYNPTSAFWAMEKVECKDTTEVIHSTYKDNDFLSKEQIAEIEDNQHDKNWWRVYGLGLVGQLEGLIYDFEQVDTMPDYNDYKHVYGIDFGFTNDPTAIVHLAVDTGRKVVYADEIAYQTRMMNADISDALDKAHVSRQVPIYADCAEPKSIAEICNAGFNVFPCDKTAPTSDKLKFQIQFVQGWKLMVTKRSLNLIKELRNYTWATDKNGNTLNQPIDMYNHILDALRYGLYSHFAKRAGYGRYVVH